MNPTRKSDLALLVLVIGLAMSLCGTGKGENKLTSIQIVGQVLLAPGIVRVDEGVTVGDVLKKAKATVFASTRSLVVIRIKQTYEHVGDKIVEGSDRRMIDLKVTSEMKIRSLPLEQGDILYVPAKRPVKR